MTSTNPSPTEPVRTCIGCRQQAVSGELVRFAALDGQLVDGAGRPGRGAWLCRDRLIECFDRASERRAWARSLRVQIEIESVRSLRGRLLDTSEG